MAKIKSVSILHNFPVFNILGEKLLFIDKPYERNKLLLLFHFFLHEAH